MRIKKFIFLILVLFILIMNCNCFAVADTSGLNIHSPSAILIDASTGKILYEKNANEKMYPASTTKVLTAILALENCELSDTTIVSYNAVMSIPNGYSHANLQVGEELTIEQLLNILLIYSANDAAVVLAEHVGGSVESFCTMLNTKALELGCTNTNFVNPNGIHNENHYSTAYDLALMGKYAMKNETFRSIVYKTFYALPSTNKYASNDRVFKTTNELLKEDTSSRPTNYYYKNAIGIKTGYTTPAKNCIIAGAARDNLEFIAVILGAEQNSVGISYRYTDCKTLFDFAFDNYTVLKLKDKGSVLKQIQIPNGTLETKDLDLILDDSITVLVESKDMNKLMLPEITLSPDLKAPIKKDDIVGTITYVVDETTYSTNLLAGNNVLESKFVTTFFKALLVIFIIYIAYISIKFIQKKKRRIY